MVCELHLNKSVKKYILNNYLVDVIAGERTSKGKNLDLFISTSETIDPPILSVVNTSF